MTDTAIRPADAGTGTDTAAREAWTAWHAEREQALTAPHGWLTPVALLRLR
ncbi:hypothetical protein HGA02_17930, partial [Cellulomonas septica]|nr:hypothetical protein [Cellulomonas septica]